MTREPTTYASDAFAAFERDGWEAAARQYADHWGSLTSQTIEPLLEAIQLESGGRLLDAACGPGWLAGSAAKRRVRAVGVDFASAMSVEAKRRHPGVALCQGDAEHLPFANECFDAVAMNFGLLHLGQPELALSEAYRVLRPGGRIAFTVWAAPDQAVGFQIVLNAVERFGKLDAGLPPGPPFFRFSDAAESERTLLRLGFQAPSVRTLALVWRLPSAEQFFEAMREGTVRTRGLLRAQTTAALASIRAAVVEGAAANRRGDSIELPMPAVLACATKP